MSLYLISENKNLPLEKYADNGNNRFLKKTGFLKIRNFQESFQRFKLFRRNNVEFFGKVQRIVSTKDYAKNTS